MNTFYDSGVMKLGMFPYPNVKPTFTMLVGIPGSGKSTYAARFLDGLHETDRKMVKYLSSDEIRGEIYGDENCQDDPGRVFTIMRERTLEALNTGYDVIYDATNISRKNRKSILDQLPVHIIKECEVIWAPIEECINRDAQRSRKVGQEVIWKMLKRFEAPYYDEGFDRIHVHITNNHMAAEYYQKCVQELNIPHDNPHHTLGVAEHCKLCYENLVAKGAPEIVRSAGYIHDIGKPLTKTFLNAKGEATEVAHYYGHQGVGAWMSYGFPVHEPILAWLISTHMAPFINVKYYESLNPLYKSWIDLLHEADKEAH